MRRKILFRIFTVLFVIKVGIVQASNSRFILDRDINSLKELLKQASPSERSNYISKLNTEEVYRIKDLLDLEPLLKECSTLNGDCHDLEKLITRESKERHLSVSKSSSQISPEEIKFFMFDYDGTLATTLTPLSEEVMILLKAILVEGKHIAIVTDQPLGQRGLADYFISPMRDFLDKKSRHLFKQIHLFPCAGAAYYRFDHEGNLDKNPVFNFSFTRDEGEFLVAKIKELTSLYEKDKFFFRDSYVSLHFSSEQKRSLAMEQLHALHEIIDKPLEFRTKMSVKGTAVLHVKTLGTNKSIAKYYILNYLIPLLSISRDQILIAGDKMGISNNENSDSKMLIFGGKNFSLGKESHPCAYQELSKQFEQGGIDLLKRFSVLR